MRPIDRFRSERFLDRNREVWDRWTAITASSAFYDVEGFKAGRSSRPGLDRLEDRLLGDVSGLRLLHLQCHFGLDSLRFARHGARTVGVDYSSAAIAQARRLAAELELEAEFVLSNVYELPERLDGAFDIAFSSHGVLGWLPELGPWAQAIARCLAPGGRFLLIESHPLLETLDERAPTGELRARYSYFQGEEPLEMTERGCYADREADLESTTYYWSHPLSEIFSSLLDAGLAIERFDEHPFLAWPYFPWMVDCGDGTWQLPEGIGDGSRRLPLSFSLLARKPKGERG